MHTFYNPTGPRIPRVAKNASKVINSDFEAKSSPVAENTQQLPHIYHRKKMSPSPLADQTINFRLARSKTSSFTMHYSIITTTLERNAHVRPQFDPKSNPF